MANAGCSAAGGQGEWGTIAARAGLLVALLVLAAWFAMRAFGAHQRSLGLACVAVV